MSQTTLFELHEYDLVEIHGRLVYSLSEVTMHPSLKLAHQFTQSRIAEEGMGHIINSTIGPIPSRAWSTTEVIGVDTKIEAGRELEEGKPKPVDPTEPPLPPDE